VLLRSEAVRRRQEIKDQQRNCPDQLVGWF
jgi:hypothetical protein